MVHFYHFWPFLAIFDQDLVICVQIFGHFSIDIWKNLSGENWVLDFVFFENEPHMKFW